MEFANFIDDFSGNSPGLSALGRSGPAAALVLDTDRRELVKASPGFGKEGLTTERSASAMKNHSEAEKRRRDRINGHLSTLRSLIPGTSKMDKASLLAEVISQVKELKKDAVEVTRGLVVPLDTDEVSIEGPDDLSDGSPCYVKASICCDYKHEILSDLRQSLDALDLKIARAEMSSLGGRMKTIINVTGFRDANSQDTVAKKQLLHSVHHVLKSVLDRFSAKQEFLSRDLLPNKRQRISVFGYSSSGDVW